jgi:hypothetical protein
MGLAQAATLISLYRQGIADQQIATAIGRNRSAVAQWRWRNGLPANGVSACLPVQPDDHQRRLDLHSAGKSDAEMGRILGLYRNAIRVWRNKHGLTPNRLSNAKRAALKALRPAAKPLAPAISSAAQAASKVELFDRARRAVGSRLPRDIAEDAISDLYVAVLEGRVSSSDVERAARKYANAALGQFANRYGPRSLDKELVDEGFNLFAIIPDRSHSTWLEEAGATVW